MAQRKKKKGKYGAPRWSTGNRDNELAAELRKLGIRTDSDATRLPR